MDVNSVARWVLHNIDTVLGACVAVTTGFLCFLSFRAMSQRSESSSGGGSSNLASLDLNKLTTMLDALSIRLVDQKSDIKEQKTAAPTSGDPNVEKTLQEKESKISALQSQLEETQKAVQDQKAQPAGSAASAELEEKLRVLQDRLAEYDIISEDLAEMAGLKQENLRLRDEINDLRKGLAAVGVSSPSPEASSAAAPDTQDEVMREFVESVGVKQAAPPSVQVSVPDENPPAESPTTSPAPPPESAPAAEAPAPVEAAAPIPEPAAAPVASSDLPTEPVAEAPPVSSADSLLEIPIPEVAIPGPAAVEPVTTTPAAEAPKAADPAATATATDAASAEAADAFVKSLAEAPAGAVPTEEKKS